VHSVADPYAETAQAYLVLPLNRGVKNTDLEFVEYSGYLSKALDALGYHHASSWQDAELVVFLGYGIGRPEDHLESYDLPASEQTGTEYRPRVEGQTSFTRYAIINAVDAKEYKAGRRLLRVWSTKIVSVGDTGDLRAMFPVIVAGAWDLLGVDSGNVVRRRVELNGAEVLWIKNLSQLSARTGEMRMPSTDGQGTPN
jgi:hypothetical protein